MTSRNSEIKNGGITYAFSSEKSNQSISYNITSINDFSGTIITHSIVHSYSRTLSEDSNLFANSSLTRMTSDQTKNFFFQNEIGFDKNYLKLHKIKSSIGTQVGKNTSKDAVNNIFLIAVKVTYDIAFSYKK